MASLAPVRLENLVPDRKEHDDHDGPHNKKDRQLFLCLRDHLCLYLTVNFPAISRSLLAAVQLVQVRNRGVS